MLTPQDTLNFQQSVI